MTRMDSAGNGLTRWPGVREVWWIVVLAAGGLLVFVVGLLTRVRCELGMCSGSAREGLLDLDAVGGLPRLFTTSLFLATGAVAMGSAVRSRGRSRLWWVVVGVGVSLLAVAKLTSAHSLFEASDGGPLALVAGLAITALVLALTATAGTRWRVVGARGVVVSLAVYAAAALGLDAVTAAVESVQTTVGAFAGAGVTFVEEFGEALAALVVLVVVRWQLPPPRVTEPEHEPRPQVQRFSPL